MKVKISVTVEVDPDAWTATYGVEGLFAIREDVKAYVTGTINASAAAEECGLQVVA